MFFFQVMGGQGSDMFEYFKILILQGLVAARKHSDKIMSLVDIMRAGKTWPQGKLSLHYTERCTYFDKLNMVKFLYGGSVVDSIQFSLLP